MEEKPYKGGGKLTTRLLGRLEILHGDGVVEFRIRSPKEIEKRKTRVILRIDGLGEIPRIEDGRSININLTFTDDGGIVSFDRKNDEATIHSDRPERRRRTA